VTEKDKKTHPLLRGKLRKKKNSLEPDTHSGPTAATTVEKKRYPRRRHVESNKIVKAAVRK